MANPDIFDEIIAYLRQESETVGHAAVSDEVMDDLFKDFPPARKAVKAQKPPPAVPNKVFVKVSEGKDICEMGFDELRSRVNSCTLCKLHSTRTNTVFADGNESAKLMFIGEGPGRDEDEQGLPFVGRAGQLLTRMINAMQFDRKEVYIANIVKCRPPDNRNPEPEEANVCMPYLTRQIELVKPKVIVLLGAVPTLYMLGKTGITKLRGHWDEYMGIKVMPTLHPAYLLRNPAAKKDAWEDLQIVMKEFGKKHIPPAKK